MMRLQFTKVEGLGNDFLLVEGDESLISELESKASQLCDRRLGVGGDGVLVLGPPRIEGSDASMIVINYDGSRPEMCGNGLRCVAERVNARTGKSELVIDTDAGSLRCRVVRKGEGVAEVRVDMGPGRRLGTTTPRAGQGRRFTGISMGNPHAIHFVEDSESPQTLAQTLGPALEIDPAYPDRTNVEFAKVTPDDPNAFELWVWERGCGITGACGTGACATAVAAHAEGLVEPGVALRMRLPGGTLEIVVPEPGAESGVMMTGPARRVFSGTVTVD